MSRRLGLSGRRVVVVGYGVSGRAAARALLDLGAKVVVSEARPDEALGAVDVPAGLDLRTGGHRPEHLEGAELVVLSPGVPESAPVVGWARVRNLPVWSEIELGARLCRVPYVAVTGTNGKTTTVEMIAAAMREAGLDARACGNVGYPFSTAATEAAAVLVVEASSFQLAFQESLHPKVSVLLNLSPDHLEWHGSFARYAAAKARIFARQDETDVHVGNHDDPAARRLSSTAPCQVRWFRRGAPGPGEVGVVGGEVVWIDGRREVEVARPGAAAPAFLTNAAAAAAAALSFGLAVEPVGRALAAFRPLPHRGEVVAETGGLRFVDDSKATNPDATLASLDGRVDVVLIAGGLAKGVDLGPLAAAAPSLRAVVVIGESAGRLEELFTAAGLPVRRATSIEDAVRLGAEAAGPDGGEILLAPACASQDMFRDYRERGERFAAAARDLADRAGRRA